MVLNNYSEKFINTLVSNFPKTSEKIHRNFGDTTQKLLRGSNHNNIKLLMLIEADSTMTAKRASKLLGVSSRTVETYIAKLKESHLIERKGSDKEGTWHILKE